MIEGGIWDQNKPDGSGDCKIFSFCHGKGLTLRNMTLLHCTNHFINMSATSDSLVENVTFRDAIPYSGDSATFWMDGIPTKTGEERDWRKKTYIRYCSLEAIHLDYANAEGEMGLFPQDDTPCERVTVRNCTFDNVFAGVGTHHTVTKKRGNNILVEGCRFDLQDLSASASAKKYGAKFGQIAQAAVNFYSFDDSAVRDCEVSDFSAAPNTRTDKLLRLLDANAEMSGNRVCGAQRGVEMGHSSLTMNGDQIYSTEETKTEYGVMIKNSKAVLKNVTIKDTSDDAVYAQQSSTLKCGSCTFTNAGKYGICLSDGSGTFSKNTVSGSANNGIMILRSTAALSGNTVTNAGAHGIQLHECGKNCVIKGNTIKNSGKAGIAVYATSSAKVQNNTVTDAAYNAIWCSPNDKAGCTNVTITGNTAKTKGSSRFDISLSAGVSKCTVTDNKIYERGIYAADKTSNVLARNARPISGAVFTLSYTAHAYTGKALKPAVTATLGGKPITSKNGDFKVAYSANLHVGTAKVTITGGNAVHGKKVLSFRITKAKNTLAAKNVSLKASAKKRTVACAVKARFPAALSYASSNSKIKVSSKGTLTIPAKFKGSFAITVKSKGTSDFSAASKKITCKVA